MDTKGFDSGLENMRNGASMPDDVQRMIPQLIGTQENTYHRSPTPLDYQTSNGFMQQLYFVARQNQLAQQNQLLMSKLDYMEKALWQMQLFATIGAPPGLSKEPRQERTRSPEGADSGSDLSTTCSGPCSLSSSPRHSKFSWTTLDPSPRHSRAQGIKEGTSTTVIIRNLVDTCSRKMLLEFLDKHGFQGKYDLVYLPLHFVSKRCFHYAFVNFLSGDIASEFLCNFNGCADEGIFGESVGDVLWSQCQGLDANVKIYRNSSVMHPSVDDECKPVMFRNGRLAPFPKPTKKIKHDRRYCSTKTSNENSFSNEICLASLA